MRIKKILSQHRRDFWATYECEHCGHVTGEERGYDDVYFHNEVVPTRECPICGKVSPEDYKPRKPIYPEGFQI